jgi:hypothetical protein
MKKIGILIFITALAIGIVLSNVFSFGKITQKFFNVSIGWGGECGSGNVVTEKREVSGFTGVDVGGAFKVEIVAGKEYSVEVEADDNLVPLVRTEVEGGVLKIETEKRISSKSELKIRISAPDIDSLESSGVSGIKLSGVKNTALNVQSSGASKINVEGTTGNLTVDVSGASTVDAANLQAENSNVDASGACSVTVNASNEVEAHASGASKIRYTGTPKNVIKKTSGASRVEQK